MSENCFDEIAARALKAFRRAHELPGRSARPAGESRLSVRAGVGGAMPNGEMLFAPEHIPGFYQLQLEVAKSADGATIPKERRCYQHQLLEALS